MGKISIEGTDIGNFAGVTISGHLYLVYEDDQGDEWVIRGQPQNTGDPYGDLEVVYKWPYGDQGGMKLEWSDDARGDDTPEDRGQTEVQFFGQSNTDATWNNLLSIAEAIDEQKFDYNPTAGINSNSTISTILSLMGEDFSDYNVNFSGLALSWGVGLGDAFWGSDNLLEFSHQRGDQSFVISGGENEDSVIGSSQSDIIGGNNGNDTIWAGNGNDLINGGNGNDVLYGDLGNNTITGGNGEDLIYAGAGQDNIRGGDGFDTLSYEKLSDGVSATVNFQDFAVSHGNHSDHATGFEAFIGTSKDDRIIFNEVVSSMEFSGGTGKDVLDFSALAGDGITLRDDAITMNLPYTTEYYFQDFEVLIATSSNDVLWLNTVPSVSDVDLGDGNDAIIAGTGALKAYGGAGTQDILNYSGIGSENSVAIKAVGSNSDIIVEEDHAAVAEIEGIEIFYGSQNNDCFDFTDVTADSLVEVDSYNGDDTMVGSSGDDIFRGGGNNDTFYTSDGVDIFDGGSGYDTFDFSTAEHGIRINCSSNEYKAVEDDGFGNHEFIWGGYEVEKIVGSHYDDHMNLYFSAAKEAHGGAGNDTIYSGHVTRKIAGGDGDDVLTSVKGSTWMYGEDGNDHLVSWGRNNHMSGGEGDDIYQVKNGDTIYGFEGAGEEDGDLICLNGIDAMRYRGFQEVNGIGAGTGQIRFVELSNGNTQAKINNDGDSYAEYSFIIADGDTHASEYTMDDIFYL